MLKTERSATLRADLALLGTAAIWGFTFPLIQRALLDISPLFLLTVRFFLAAIIMLPIYYSRLIKLSPSGKAFSILLGLLLALGSILQTIGLKYTSPTKSAFITALYIVIVPVIVILIERVRPRLSSLLAAGIAITGLYVMTSPSGGINPGDWLTVGCAFAFAFHIVVADLVTIKHDPVGLSFGQIITSAMLCGMLLVTTHQEKCILSAWVIFAIIITGVFATFLGFTIQLWAQRETSATHVTIIFATEPLWAAVFSRIMQHEILSLNTLMGGALIIFAVLLSQVGARKY